MPKAKITKGISFPDEEFLEMAKERADSLGISFSNYIQQLIKQDHKMDNLFDNAAQPIEATRKPRRIKRSPEKMKLLEELEASEKKEAG